MTEKADKRGPRVEIVGDPAQIAERIREASGVYSGLDKALIPSVAATIGGLSTKSIFGDAAALSEAAKSFEAMRSIVAPQIADALAGFTVPKPMPSVAAAMAIGIDKAQFDFAKKLGGNYAGALPQLAKMLQTMTSRSRSAATSPRRSPPVRKYRGSTCRLA